MTAVIQYKQFNQIHDNLWMGGTPAALTVMPPEFKQFRTIINLYPWEQYELEDHHVYCQIKMLDNLQFPDEKLVVSLADYVNSMRMLGPVLVHCQQGWNRSGLIVAVALIRNGIEPKNAIALMREKRMPEVLSNPVFEAWLLQTNFHVGVKS